jgi:hypothetical protein
LINFENACGHAAPWKVALERMRGQAVTAIIAADLAGYAQ